LQDDLWCLGSGLRDSRGAFWREVDLFQKREFADIKHQVFGQDAPAMEFHAFTCQRTLPFTLQI
jgi:hypothetical protein